MASTPAGDVDYETSGTGYENLRRTDARIDALIRRQLGPAATVLNVGAGAGSYEPADRYVIAVEPSAAMRARRAVSAAVPAVDTSADDLPFDENAFDAAMAVFTVHQWPDPGRGLRELRRVAAGPVVIMTLDVDALAGFWLADYLPERLDVERRRFPGLADITSAVGGRVAVTPVPIPRDCTDGFVEAYYARPESLLDEHVRAAQSCWQFLDPETVRRGLARLADDLETGVWDRRHGHLRVQPTYAGPLVVLTSRPE